LSIRKGKGRGEKSVTHGVVRENGIAVKKKEESGKRLGHDDAVVGDRKGGEKGSRGKPIRTCSQFWKTSGDFRANHKDSLN